MKAQKTYLKGKSVFIVSIVVVLLTIATVYFTGINYHRSIENNLYISLIIIGTALFLFMTYGLYKGVELIDNFIKFKDFEPGSTFHHSNIGFDMPSIDTGDGLSGLILSILAWIAISILFVILMIVLEAVFWVSLFVILAMLYWVFFRALRLVFSKSNKTKGDLGMSGVYAMGYSILYIGWMFGIVYLVQILK
ncbi:hypothetical protein [Allomuricauda sp. SCSIO 65647]|uniref:hypothetical protein n=1 Tax=Allomuricauda sp. SCSIO 65647 TaxID=2908843 RepID=UPI001F3392CE|nr:hypothetical protein [Muricauda sp. SCSIO 65647]UJH68622.1 hypothetical protein L0P89_05260 [Muricauda sp. SCSIO 65647]